MCKKDFYFDLFTISEFYFYTKIDAYHVHVHLTYIVCTVIKFSNFYCTLQQFLVDSLYNHASIYIYRLQKYLNVKTIFNTRMLIGQGACFYKCIIFKKMFYQ